MTASNRLAATLAMGSALAFTSAVAAPAASVDASSHVTADAALARWCTALRLRVDVFPGDGPLLLRSYDAPAEGVGEPALATAAFTYDNALAVMALLACDAPAQARRIGEALRLAANATRDGQPQRLRNTYRAGPVRESPLPNGWWDDASQRWVEDAYQVGTATGNVAWAGLALAALGHADASSPWSSAATRLAGWAVEHTRDTRGDGGFAGGLHGFDDAPQRLAWKSTEHNVDLVALFDALDAAGDAAWRTPRAEAWRFVEAQWQTAEGHFLTGTLPDGVTPNHATSGLDAQLWPLLLREPPADWRRTLAWAEKAHGVDGGFDFNNDRDGVWIEGTAQAALVYRVLGDDAKARRALALVAEATSPGGFVYATREASLTTGLAIGPDSTTADFLYYRRPHLGATAWAILAATGSNPFALRVPTSAAREGAPSNGRDAR
ncbi:hypothetical protein ACQQ2N_12760 [Dokdonella sp. MW10]|uniref:hypothetical protein n=1 Tax=Dokdonella sp. MW10 TaxID=2992926 RepID=UPI003F8089DE